METSDVGDVVRLTDTDLVKQIQEVTFNYSWFDENGERKRERLVFEMTWLFPRELKIMLERNGFSLQHLYGDYEGEDLKNDSARMIAVARLHARIRPTRA
jgi:hypothetical protein